MRAYERNENGRITSQDLVWLINYLFGFDFQKIFFRKFYFFYSPNFFSQRIFLIFKEFFFKFLDTPNINTLKKDNICEIFFKKFTKYQKYKKNKN